MVNMNVFMHVQLWKWERVEWISFVYNKASMMKFGNLAGGWKRSGYQFKYAFQFWLWFCKLILLLHLTKTLLMKCFSKLASYCTLLIRMLIEIKLPIKLPLRGKTAFKQPKLYIILVNLLEAEVNLLLWAYGNLNHCCSRVYCKIYPKIGKIKRPVSTASHSKLIDDASTS